MSGKHALRLYDAGALTVGRKHRLYVVEGRSGPKRRLPCVFIKQISWNLGCGERSQVELSFYNDCLQYDSRPSSVLPRSI